MLNKFKLFFVTLLAVLFSVNASATVITGIPTVTVGGRVFTDTTNLIMLVCANQNTNGCTFRKPGSSTGYLVPVGKTFKAQALQLNVTVGASNSLMSVGYADNDVGVNTSTAPTNPVYAAGNSLASGFFNLNLTGAPLQVVLPDFLIPAQKYIYQVASGGTATYATVLFGYEQ